MTHRSSSPLAAVRRALRRTALMLVAALMLPGCATPPAARTELTLTGWSTDVNRPLPAAAVVTATLKFHVDDFTPDTYTVSAQADTTLPDGRTVNIGKPSAKPMGNDGELQVTLDLADALKVPDVRKPLRLRFLLIKRVSKTQGVPVASTGEINLQVDGLTSSPPMPAVANAQLTVSGWSADISRPLPQDAVVTATLKFHVDDFEPDTYIVAAPFDTTRADMPMLDFSKTPLKLKTNDSEVKVTLRLAEALNEPGIRKPLRVRFALLKRVSSKGYEPVIMTDTIELPVVGSAP